MYVQLRKEMVSLLDDDVVDAVLSMGAVVVAALIQSVLVSGDDMHIITIIIIIINKIIRYNNLYKLNILIIKR
ncbi:hypothetical protein DERP_013725 [Dermatophagoides pteronyssinus]|uniref:Uncharacterized protein n=1 Tax=Dermatophagoides pteronyssinus TaxID=6956 RepID=A0ABQ8JF99_DERPT|nr:hypothetical protein DERP_013725 [Dermatophagoides pteronyssinus]